MIYRDALGRPNSEATVSLFGCPPFSARNHSLTCASDCPARGLYDAASRSGSWYGWRVSHDDPPSGS